MEIEKLFNETVLPPIYRRDGKDCYFDPYRNKLIMITPEETVRQRTAALFEHRYGVPKDMITLEEAMSHYVHGVAGRADIILHAASEDGQTIYPVAVVECKNADVILTDKVADQAIRYCDVLGAKYIILTNGLELLIAAYDEKKDCYVYLDDMLNYEQMLDGKFDLPKEKNCLPERLTTGQLHDQQLLAQYNEENWVFGDNTELQYRPFIVNLYQCLLDTSRRLPKTCSKAFELVEDIGMRFMDYSNAGGGHYCGIYRSFLVKDRCKEPQIVSVSIFGTDADFRNEHRNSYTSLVVAVDHFKTSHNSLQYNVDRFAERRADGSVAFYHNGQIGGFKSKDVIENICRNGKGLTVRNGNIFLGELAEDKLFYLDDTDVSLLVGNLIEYALLREEVRRKKKNTDSPV